ncbi:phosphoadenosine phosphosulfate reductase family protein [Pseudomonas savastanoi]|uniref:Phosphoadenosine phosphosulphate reductase domain-containing protein n=1 Tax=Pseudomonas savastanoi pv. savastanoi NCPPB 3335 TaxID=693985 RepID=A0ABC8B7T0_PSESS|nr:phosphoadenosine phosphosulfate reductase family protein [Pseudomonas savastanoi]ARD10127.1 hypothetical protein PSA3335_02955 [Pseudomonas savastanoi pv. savastanoi NCPPB 3335]
MSTHNIVSVSGGKDSTATLLVAIALDTPNLQAVFADTGNEHEQTYATACSSAYGLCDSGADDVNDTNVQLGEAA